MALNGTITGTANNSRYSLTCEWSATQNISANTSTITAIVYLNGNGYSTYSSNWSCVINGVTVTSGKGATVSGKTELGRRTWTVSHNNDGTCSTNISFSYKNTVPSSTYITNNGSGEGNITLNTIPRGSTFTLNRGSAIIGTDAITLNISRASSSYTHRIQLFFGSYSTLLAQNVDTSYTFTPNIGLCNQIPNATSGTATIKVQTMNGNTWIGEATKTITLNVPTTMTPYVGIDIVANNQLGTTNISGRTTFTVTPTNVSGTFGSTIKSYQISGTGLSTTSANGGISSTVSSGDHVYTVKVTDSRGRTKTASQTVKVYSYSPPTLSLQTYRSDVNGNAIADGTYVYGNLTYDISNPNNANFNAKQYLLYKRRVGTASWTQVGSWTTFGAYSGTIKVNFGDGFLITSSYEFKVDIRDSLNTVTVNARVGTISALLNIEKEGVGVGKIHERGKLDVAGNVYVEDNIYLYNTSNKIVGLCIKNGIADVWVARQATHGGVDLGDSASHSAICSVDNPTWWNGTKNFDMWTNQTCTVVSGGSGGTSYRFHNGMQVNIMQIYGTWNIATAWGSVFSSPHITPSNYVQAFLTPPQVSITAHGAGTAVMVCQAGAPTTTMPGTYYLWKPVQQTGVRNYVEIISIGRWK